MRVKLHRHDGHFYLPLDASSVAAMGANADTLFDVSVEGDRLIVSPVDAAQAQEEERLMNKIERNYDSMFRRLAD